MRAEVASPTYLGGLSERDRTAIVDPARLAWGLARACLEAGVRIHENTPVDGADAGDGVAAHAQAGRLRAHRVALATSAFPPSCAAFAPTCCPSTTTC